MNKVFALFVIWLSFFLKKRIFSQVFEFLIFFFLSLHDSFGTERRIRLFLIHEIIERGDFNWVETLFIEYHLVLHHILQLEARTPDSAPKCPKSHQNGDTLSMSAQSSAKKTVDPESLASRVRMLRSKDFKSKAAGLQHMHAENDRLTESAQSDSERSEKALNRECESPDLDGEDG